jgi:protein deglycase
MMVLFNVMKKKILVILTDGFEDMEAVAPIDILNRAGVEVTIASLVDGPVKAAYGTTIIPHTTLDKAGVNFDGVVLPGGVKNAQSLAGSADVVRMVTKFQASGKLVAAICASPALVLAEKTDMLRGVPATCSPGFEDHLKKAGAIVTGERVTCHENIITGMGPGAALEFGLAVARYLTGDEIPNELKAKWRI